MKFDDLFRYIVDEGNDIVYVSDIENYELYYLNKSSLSALGFSSEEEWRGKPCYKVLQGLDQPCEFCTNHLLKENRFYVWEYTNPVLKRSFSLRNKLVEIDGRKMRLEIANDITKQAEVAERMKKQLNLEETLLACVRTLNENQDVSKAIQELLELIGNYHNADRAYIFETDEKGEKLYNTFEWCGPNVVPQIEVLQDIPVEVVDLWYEQFETVGEFYITSLKEDVDRSSDAYRILEMQDIDSLMAAPLRLERKIVGFLGVDNPRENTDEMMLLRSVASFIINDLIRQRMSADLKKKAYIDGLTGFGNRLGYMERLQELDQEALDSLGVIFVDINGLKLANDSHGHEYGDFLVMHTAEVLQQIFSDSIYRIGGDEFVIFCADMSKEIFDQKVEEIRKCTEMDEEFRVSVGDCWNPGGKNIMQQIAQADQLMYVDKQEYYSGRLDTQGNYQAMISRELIREIQNGSFAVYLQPKFELKTGSLLGAEALVRKFDDRGKLIPPDRFIPRYEAEGIIRHVDFFVLEEVCKQLKQWEEEGKPELTVSVNLSRITLQEHGIVGKIAAVCDQYGIGHGKIDVEVTERIGVMKEDVLQELISSLRENGFRISLDDFGSEYSNLAILTTLDFDEIKLDKSLIDNLENNPKARVVAAHIINVCKELNHTRTVAEGIETEGQRKLLLEQACDVGQGYLFDRPMPIDQFVEKYLNQKD